MFGFELTSEPTFPSFKKKLFDRAMRNWYGQILNHRYHNQINLNIALSQPKLLRRNPLKDDPRY